MATAAAAAASNRYRRGHAPSGKHRNRDLLALADGMAQHGDVTAAKFSQLIAGSTSDEMDGDGALRAARQSISDRAQGKDAPAAGDRA